MCQELLASKGGYVDTSGGSGTRPNDSLFAGVNFGRLHYRRLDMKKTHALKWAKGNYDH
jgi:hypothetical protein